MLKLYCSVSQQHREAGHYCYMRPLTNELRRRDNVLFVFYDFETTQDTRLTESAMYTFRIFFAFSISAPSVSRSLI